MEEKWPKEHGGSFGTFRSAFSCLPKAEVLKIYAQNESYWYELMKRLDVRMLNDEMEEVKNPSSSGKDRFVYDYVSSKRWKTRYRVLVKPSWLTWEEAALVIDGGSLSNGFERSGKFIDINE